MSFFDILNNSKPIITPLDKISINEIESSTDIYYIILSVELGNTTTKAIITATNLNNNSTYLLNKTVKMTRESGSYQNDEILGSTIWGINLSKKSISNFIINIINESINAANIKINDIDFVVRSTGVTASFTSPKQVGDIIIALANGCIGAGIPTKKMIPPLSINNIPQKLRQYSYFKTVKFDGSVASSLPPSHNTIVANEMEGELITLGIKLASKSTNIDYRNPCISIDLGTTLAGRIINNDKPYAKTIANFCGLGGAISDALIQKIDNYTFFSSILDLEKKTDYNNVNWDESLSIAEKLHKKITIKKIPENFNSFGTIPITSKQDIILIGCDVGKNGDKLDQFRIFGQKIYENLGLNNLFAIIDILNALIVKRLIKITIDENLIKENSVIGITGRAGITGKKPEIITDFLKENFQSCLFVSDGLALGASLMARCMNSLGTPTNPIGGQQKGKCIMVERQKLQNTKKI